MEKLQRNPIYLKLINATAFWASGAIKSLKMVFFMNFLTGFLEKIKFNDCTDIQDIDYRLSASNIDKIFIWKAFFLSTLLNFEMTIQ